MLQVAPNKEETTSLSSPKTVTLDVGGMKCAGCVKSVERQLTKNPGVISATVNLVTEVAVVNYKADSVKPETLADKLTSTGFPTQVRAIDPNAANHPLQKVAERRQKDNRQQFWQLVAAGILLFFSILGHLNHIGGPTVPGLSSIWFHWGLATIAIMFPGRPIAIDGWRSLRQGMPNMNSLVGIGTISAYLASCVGLFFPKSGWECFFDEPVMLLGFILLGRFLEARARGKASAALEKLVSLQPQSARLIGQPDITQSSIEIPVEQVRVGEWIQVLPGEKIPVDGELVVGQTTVNEAMLTGEALPVTKKPKDAVAAGTINQSGTIVLQTTRTGTHTTLAKIIALVEEAQMRKAPVQQLADTVAGYFAYGVMAVATLTFLFWYLGGTKIWPEVLLGTASVMEHHQVTTTSPLLLSLKLAIAVLVVACPCALGLATPTAILVGTSVGAEHGLLIKGGDVLERVHQLNIVAFDKTGTLTVGHPTITDCIPLNDISPDYLLQLAATVERGTNHPLAIAIVSAAQVQELPLLEAEAFHTEPGLGVSASLGGELLYLGNQDWIEKQEIPISAAAQAQAQELAQAGKTVVYLANAIRILGLFGLCDRLREDARETVQQLQNLGLEVVLLTGDRPMVAQAIAQQVGITRVFAGVKPEQKAEIIKSLQQGEQKHKEATVSTVAMIGDGINDAPALAQADIGISLQGGTDIAIETADIVLVSGRLLDVVESIRLSLATFHKIRQNLFWALGYNTFTIPIAAGFLLPNFGIVVSPAAAGALMASSSIMVVTNSLLLRRQYWHSK